MKKIIALLLVVAMTAAASVAGTIAYLQDTDSDVNVMTLGSVYIKQHEYERVDYTKLPTEDNLKAFSQGKPAIPAVYEGTSIPWDTASIADQAWKVVEPNKNVIDKFVTVENTGRSAAYVRTVFAIEVGKNAVNDDYMHIVNNAENITNADPDAATWKWEWLDGVATIGETDYAIAIATYTEPLKGGETTIPSLKQIYLDKTATNEVVEKYGDLYDILVVSQAVQVDGFANAADALNAAFNPITNTEHPWKDGYSTPIALTEENIETALKEAESGDVFLLTAGNYDNIVMPSNTSGITIIGSPEANISNLNLNAATNIVIEGVTFNAADAGPVYNNTGAETDFVANITGSTIEGKAKSAKDVIIRNCTFTGSYDGTKAFVPICFEDGKRPTNRLTNITIENCTFDCDAPYYIRLSYAAAGTVTINGNTFGSETNPISSSSTFSATGNSANWVITNNKIYNGTEGDNIIFTSRNGSHVIDMTITGNTFYDSDYNNVDFIRLQPSYTAANTNVTFSGNTFTGDLSAYNESTIPCVIP